MKWLYLVTSVHFRIVSPEVIEVPSESQVFPPLTLFEKKLTVPAYPYTMENTVGAITISDHVI